MPPVLTQTVVSKFIWGIIPFGIDSEIVMQKIIFNKYFNINLKKKEHNDYSVSSKWYTDKQSRKHLIILYNNTNNKTYLRIQVIFGPLAVK